MSVLLRAGPADQRLLSLRQSSSSALGRSPRSLWALIVVGGVWCSAIGALDPLGVGACFSVVSVSSTDPALGDSRAVQLSVEVPAIDALFRFAHFSDWSRELASAKEAKAAFRFLVERDDNVGESSGG